MKHLFLFISIFLMQHAISQAVDCASVREGTFTLVDIQVGNSTLIRDGQYQYEIQDGSTDTTVFEVTWVDSCTYTLKPTAETLTKNPNWPKNLLLTFAIREVNEKGYTFEANNNLFPMELKGQAEWKNSAR